MSREVPKEGVRDALRRARWRMRGAWLAPTFAVMTIIEGVMLHLLPLAGDDTPVVGGLILAGCLNLAVVAVFAPLGGRLLQRRRADLPRDVARDRAGTVDLMVLFAVLLAVGIANAAN